MSMKYPYIYADAALAGSKSYWPKEQSERAAADGAPRDAVTKALENDAGAPGIVNGWRTLAFYEAMEAEGRSTMLGINATRLKQAAKPFL